MGEVTIRLEADESLIKAINDLAHAMKLFSATRNVMAEVAAETSQRVEQSTLTEKPAAKQPKKPEHIQEELDLQPTEEQEPEPETENIPTVVELRAAAQEKGKTPEGKRAIKALLQEFGSRSISDVPEEKRAAFMARLKEL